jgi:hypothetical protein
MVRVGQVFAALSDPLDIREGGNAEGAAMKRTVSYRIGGRWARGSNTESDGMVHVECEYGTRSAQIGGSPPLVIARLVFRELADEALERAAERKKSPDERPGLKVVGSKRKR